MKRETLDIAINALRTTKLRQIKGRTQDGKGGACAIGAIAIALREAGYKESEAVLASHSWHWGVRDNSIVMNAGFDATGIYHRNDGFYPTAKRPYTFGEIANWLEATAKAKESWWARRKRLRAQRRKKQLFVPENLVDEWPPSEVPQAWVDEREVTKIS